VLVCSPKATNFLINHLDVLNFGEKDSFAGGNGEEVALDGDAAFPDLDVLVIVVDGGCQVHWAFLNNNKFLYYVNTIRLLRLHSVIPLTFFTIHLSNSSNNFDVAML
jgi:hypothetical protein